MTKTDFLALPAKSAIIRGEKYTPGMWQALVQNGILLDLLVRERDLKQKA